MCFSAATWCNLVAEAPTDKYTSNGQEEQDGKLADMDVRNAEQQISVRQIVFVEGTTPNMSVQTHKHRMCPEKLDVIITLCIRTPQSAFELLTSENMTD